MRSFNAEDSEQFHEQPGGGGVGVVLELLKFKLDFYSVIISQNLLFAHLEMTKVAKSADQESFITTHQSKARFGLANDHF